MHNIDNSSWTALFSLIKVSLWGVENKMDVSEINWKHIVALAKRQTISGLLFDGIDLLCKSNISLKIPLDIKLGLIGQVRAIERQNTFINDKIAELFREYESIGVKPILMKGQSVATRYSHPNHRQSGDVDLLFINQEQLQNANGWANVNGSNLDGFYQKHLSFQWNGIIVENHNQLSPFSKKLYREYFDEVVRQELNENNKLPKRNIDHCEVYEMPTTLYAFFLLVHMSYHILEDGLGLRQVCDWILFLKEHHSQIDKQKFSMWTEHLGLAHLANAFGSICVEYMGLPKSYLPFSLQCNLTYEKLLLEEIMYGGNFGRNYYQYKGKVSKFEDMWHTLWIKMRRYAHIYKLWPQEAMANYGMLIKRGIKRIARI